jgi:hypothetical protein
LFFLLFFGHPTLLQRSRTAVLAAKEQAPGLIAWLAVTVAL